MCTPTSPVEAPPPPPASRLARGGRAGLVLRLALMRRAGRAPGSERTTKGPVIPRPRGASGVDGTRRRAQGERRSPAVLHGRQGWPHDQHPHHVRRLGRPGRRPARRAAHPRPWRGVDPGDPGYDEARTVSNGLIDRRPALIARCSGVADVVAAVNFARDARSARSSVRGGGHNVAGNAVNDGGLVIDLSSMRGVRVDPASRTVRAQGGATWGDVDRETQLFGLATPGGVVSTTGVGGLTLHGGCGWLRRKYGLRRQPPLGRHRHRRRPGAHGQRDASTPTSSGRCAARGSNFGVVTSLRVPPAPGRAAGRLCRADLRAGGRPTGRAAPGATSWRRRRTRSVPQLLFWSVPAARLSRRSCTAGRS